MQAPADVVTALLKATEHRDVAEILRHLAPDIRYQNMPLPTVRGARAVARQFGLLHRLYTGCEVEITNIATNGEVVLTERFDVIRRGDWSARFWVCGTFVVRDGRIVLWRDYYDQAALLGSALAGLGRMALAGVRGQR
ncbi:MULTISPECIES: limonene-1,2-epoxide hydrolase family protein [unclassified Crossiella]|uniref:limonene-1,2-epoxide hydrolase family protein n=1 Tax=unclassified Crossiella TaxID=2620835 RepID=UPI001FFFEC35|nr:MULTISPECIES: limonene-1,2-epoxide hydrolase family protein [unclassified Crossiella]MCK2242950.1 nuclear transport factor 2 family protein [Crossiella sp. S99.2]MCK2256827.1 nuclear transport factor 2 family protein [Crossiella sp. S99.1]